MIYLQPQSESSVDQGDIIDNCPLAFVDSFDKSHFGQVQWSSATSRIFVLTQTCDLANRKSKHATVSVVFDAQELVHKGLLKPADIRGPIRSGRVYGWYFLPMNADADLPEMIVDLRQLHTVRMDLLSELCVQNHRRARLTDLYRAHLGKHFADTYSRIGLPEPYATVPE